MVTGWARLAGGLRPAMLTATARNSIFSPTGRPFTLNWFLSTGSWLAASHWSAGGESKRRTRCCSPSPSTETGTTPSHTGAGTHFPLCSTR